MVDFFDKIVKFFTKLNDYSILRVEKDYIIVAVWISINESKGLSVNPMHPNEVIKVRDFQVVFAITAENLSKESKNFLKDCNLLTLKPSKDDLKSLNYFIELLDRFKRKHF